MIRAATHIMQAGWGADYGDNNFLRVLEDTPVRAAPGEYAKPNYLIVYRISDGERLHVQKQALRDYLAAERAELNTKRKA